MECVAQGCAHKRTEQLLAKSTAKLMNAASKLRSSNNTLSQLIKDLASTHVAYSILHSMVKANESQVPPELLPQLYWSLSCCDTLAHIIDQLTSSIDLASQEWTLAGQLRTLLEDDVEVMQFSTRLKQVSDSFDDLNDKLRRPKPSQQPSTTKECPTCGTLDRRDTPRIVEEIPANRIPAEKETSPAPMQEVSSQVVDPEHDRTFLKCRVQWQFELKLPRKRSLGRRRQQQPRKSLFRSLFCWAPLRRPRGRCIESQTTDIHEKGPYSVPDKTLGRRDRVREAFKNVGCPPQKPVEVLVTGDETLAYFLVSSLNWGASSLSESREKWQTCMSIVSHCVKSNVSITSDVQSLSSFEVDEMDWLCSNIPPKQPMCYGLTRRGESTHKALLSRLALAVEEDGTKTSNLLSLYDDKNYRIHRLAEQALTSYEPTLTDMLCLAQHRSSEATPVTVVCENNRSQPLHLVKLPEADDYPKSKFCKQAFGDDEIFFIYVVDANKLSSPPRCSNASDITIVDPFEEVAKDFEKQYNSQHPRCATILLLVNYTDVYATARENRYSPWEPQNGSEPHDASGELLAQNIAEKLEDRAPPDVRVYAHTLDITNARDVEQRIFASVNDRAMEQKLERLKLEEMYPRPTTMQLRRRGICGMPLATCGGANTQGYAACGSNSSEHAVHAS